MTIVSGADIDLVTALLEDARDAINNDTSKSALVYDAQETILYDQRGYEVDSYQARLFEFVKVATSGLFVVLVANEHDRDAERANRWGKRTILLDTFLDIFDSFKVGTIRAAFSPVYGKTREIWSFLDKLYYYNVTTDEVTFLKNQNPDR